MATPDLAPEEIYDLAKIALAQAHNINHIMWTYRTRVLDEDYVVVDQDGIATVVQDELQNTYQLAGLPE